MTVFQSLRRGSTRPGLLAVLLLALSLALAGCGADATATPQPPTPAPPTAVVTTGAADTPTAAASGAAPIAVTLLEYSIDPKTIDATGGKVTFQVTNKGKLPHNFAVVSNGQELGKTKNLGNGQSETLTLDLQAGTYQTICDLPGHKDQGMLGTLTVK